MVLPPSCLWGSFLFRHAGRVELYANTPPTTGEEKTRMQRKDKAKKKKMTHAADRINAGRKLKLREERGGSQFVPSVSS